MSTSVLIADDHTIVRQGLRHVIEKDGHFSVVAEAANGFEAAEKSCEFDPDIIVMDVKMPESDGIEATKNILTRNSGSKVLVLSAYARKDFLSKMLRAGAKGYILKHRAGHELREAMNKVLQNQIYICSIMSHMIVDEYVNLNLSDGDFSRSLTEKETIVLAYITQGLNTKEIASKLNISPKTVDARRRKIMEKLNIHSVAGLVKFAVKNGIASLD